MRNVLLIGIVFLSISFLEAQEFTPSLRWKGEVRVRSEIDMRDFNNTTAANTYTLLRSRLGMEAIPVERVKVFLQAQDSRMFGQERDQTNVFNTQADTRNLDLHQGYVEVSNLFIDELTLRLGRQELAYGTERIIGAVNFGNVGRAFDGGLLRFNFPSTQLDLLAMNIAEVQNYSPIATPAASAYFRDGGYDLYGAYATVNGIEDIRLDLYALYQWNRAITVPGSDDLSRVTLGAYGRDTIGHVDIEAELGYQGGKQMGVDVSAYMVVAGVGYTFPEAPMSRISVNYERLSGTPAGDAKMKTFDPTFHTGHKFYGFMDYFINIPVNTTNAGLQDILLRGSTKFTDVTLNVWLHNFFYAEELAGTKDVGQELDVTATYRYNQGVTFDAGLSAFLPGEAMRAKFGGASTAWWAYLSTSVGF